MKIGKIKFLPQLLAGILVALCLTFGLSQSALAQSISVTSPEAGDCRRLQQLHLGRGLVLYFSQRQLCLHRLQLYLPLWT